MSKTYLFVDGTLHDWVMLRARSKELTLREYISKRLQITKYRKHQTMGRSVLLRRGGE